jgi:hypothetical protein
MVCIWTSQQINQKREGTLFTLAKPPACGRARLGTGLGRDSGGGRLGCSLGRLFLLTLRGSMERIQQLAPRQPPRACLSPPGKRRAERLGVAALGEGWMLDGMHPAARTEAAAASVLVAAGEAAGGEVGGDVGRGWSRGRGGHRVVGSGVRGWGGGAGRGDMTGVGM